jgi:hypothetical protein
MMMPPSFVFYFIRNAGFVNKVQANRLALFLKRVIIERKKEAAGL